MYTKVSSSILYLLSRVKIIMCQLVILIIQRGLEAVSRIKVRYSFAKLSYESCGPLLSQDKGSRITDGLVNPIDRDTNSESPE